MPALGEPGEQEGTTDDNVASGAKAAEKNFGWGCRKWRQNLRDIGWADTDQFQGIGFKHETQKFLVRFGLKDNGFSVETIVQQNFIWGQHVDLGVTQDQAIVHIANVANKKVMVGEDGFETGGPHLFADGHHNEAEGW